MKTRNKFILGIILPLLFLILVIVYFATRRTSESPAVGEAPAVAPPARRRARDLYHQALPKSTVKATATSSPDPHCASTWTYLAESSFDQLNLDLETGRFALDINCLKSRPDITLTGLSSLKKCLLKTLPENPDDLKLCQEELRFYRARVIAELSKNDPNPSSVVLMNRILALFSRPDIMEKGLDEAVKTAEQLVAAEPDLYAARKALVTGRMLEGVRVPNGDAELRLMESIRQAQRLNPGDSEVFEAGLTPDLSREDFSTIASKVDEFEKQNPQSGMPYYYRASIAWRQNNREQTTAHLNEAIRREPQNQRFRRTLEKTSKAPLGERNLFGLDMNFDFSGI